MKKFECFRLDSLNQRLWLDGTKIPIPPKPFAVLRYLVENAGRLVSHDELMENLWPETYVQPQVLRTYVLDLRKILKDDAGRPRFIQTLPKRGYCFVAAVTDCADTSGSSVPSPTASDSQRKTIVGRDGELAALLGHVELLADGQRRVVLVTGEAGIGKTALVDEFCRRVDSSNAAIVARGACVPGPGLAEEYYPVMEAVRHLCAARDGEAACRVLSAIAPAWLARGMTSEAESHLKSRQEVQPRLVGDLCDALEKLSIVKPLVLIFEDLEWADQSTLHLISAIARRRATANLLVLATHRSTKGLSNDGLAELRHDLTIRKLCTELTLAPLSRKDVGKLLSRELNSQTLPAGLDAFVAQRADGNPLFAIAILEHMISESVLVRDNCQQWKGRIPFAQMEPSVPHELAQMIELEIGRLSAEQQRILEAGSLMSLVFPAWAVSAAMQKDATEIEEACEELARRVHFVERAGQDELPDGSCSAFFVFAHGLYREVIYQRQASSRRAKGHVRIAARLCELFAGREADVAREAALHFEAGGDWRNAVKCLRAAASLARQHNAALDAAELIDQAMRVAQRFSESVGHCEAQAICNELEEELARMNRDSILNKEMIAKA